MRVYPLRLALIVAAYFAAASLALALTRFDGGVAFLWVASSLLIADLMNRSRRDWGWPLVGCGLASFVATGCFGLGWAAAAPFALANLIEAVVAVALLRRLGARTSPLGSMAWLGRFIFCVGLLAPVPSALIGALVAGIKGNDAITSGVHFYVGHALGNITFTPVALLAFQSPLRSLRQIGRRPLAEGAVLLALVALVTAAVFAQTVRPILFLPLLPVIFCAIRVGPVGAVLSVLLVALIGGGATLAGSGPVQLNPISLGNQMQFFQFYLATLILASLPVAADLEEKSRLHRKLRLSEERYRLIADHSSDIILHLEDDAHIRYVSPSIEFHGGYDPQALIGTHSARLIDPAFLDHVAAMHIDTVGGNGRTTSFDYRGLTVDGSERWFETHARAVIDEDGARDGVLCIVRDITDRKRQEDEFRIAAMNDFLTGLPNRRAFRETIAARGAATVGGATDCIAIVDLDHFKSVNDRFGHDAGDAVLCEFARVARSIVRPGDMVARLGGEEFGLFLPDTDRDAAIRVCDRLRSAMANHVTIVGGVPIRVTLSGGVATLGINGLDHSLKCADAALYRAKLQGRDRMTLAA